MQRRTFLLGSAAAAATAAAASVGGGLIYRHEHSTPGENTSFKPAGTSDPVVLTRQKPNAGAPNVLFLALDDCNDWVGFLANHPGTVTPNLDALAKTSLSFTKAYCVAPMCNPARTGVMFGEQPFTGGVYDHSATSFQHYDQVAASTPSLVEDIYAAGYTTIGAGKVFNDAETKRWNKYNPTKYYADYADRKSTPGRYDPNWLSPYDGQAEGDGSKFTPDMIDFGPSGKDRDSDPEGQASAWVASQLNETYNEPFFLAYGAICTHLPWRIPQQYFDMHPIDQIVLPDYVPNDLDDIPAYAKRYIIDTQHIFARLRKDHLWGRAVQAYQAAISYADDCVGRVLDSLAHSQYADDTIVMLWSDHGFHMGEKMHIEKFTIWEHGTHVPLLMHVPGTFATSQTFTKPVSTIDIGPTLMDLVGGKINSSHHQGKSLLPVIANPSLADDRPPLMTWRAGNNAVRRDQWRYIRYVDGSVELYDQSNDPEELTNLAGHPDVADTEKTLAAFLPPVPPGAANNTTATAPAVVGNGD